jgi:sortase A
MLPKTSNSLPIPLNSPRSLLKKIAPSALIFVGLVCLLIAAYPVLNFSLQRLLYPNRELINPLDTSVYPAPIFVGNIDDNAETYRQAANWFTKTIPLPSPAVSKVSGFTLAIPSVKLVNVPVEINGTDLKKNAIHYPGTSLPGEYGNVVIFGHSALPQFYSPGNSLTIFNPLLKVKVGDLILVNYDNFEFIYRVTKTTEVEADQIEVLAQNYSAREITLITCVPLGTYWHRLVIRGEIVK